MFNGFYFYKLVWFGWETGFIASPEISAPATILINRPTESGSPRCYSTMSRFSLELISLLFTPVKRPNSVRSCEILPFFIPFFFAFQLTRRGPCISEVTSTALAVHSEHDLFVGRADAIYGWVWSKDYKGGSRLARNIKEESMRQICTRNTDVRIHCALYSTGWKECCKVLASFCSQFLGVK